VPIRLLIRRKSILKAKLRIAKWGLAKHVPWQLFTLKRLVLALKLYLSPFFTLKLLFNKMLNIKLNILYILIASLSYLNKLSYFLLRFSLDFFIKNTLYYLKKLKPNKAIYYFFEPLIHGTIYNIF
jgi:hypothetical protein